MDKISILPVAHRGLRLTPCFSQQQDIRYLSSTARHSQPFVNSKIFPTFRRQQNILYLSWAAMYLVPFIENKIFSTLWRHQDIRCLSSTARYSLPFVDGKVFSTFRRQQDILYLSSTARCSLPYADSKIVSTLCRQQDAVYLMTTARYSLPFVDSKAFTTFPLLTLLCRHVISYLSSFQCEGEERVVWSQLPHHHRRQERMWRYKVHAVTQHRKRLWDGGINNTAKTRIATKSFTEF